MTPTRPRTAGSSCPRRASPTSRTPWARTTGRKLTPPADLEERSFDWLCEQGHVGLERVAKARRDPAIVAPVKAALEVLAAIFARLKGDPTVLPAARANLLLPPLLADGETLIWLDGPEHFTSHRLAALELYPADAPLGFDRDEHMALCRDLAPRTDAIGRGLAAKGFGFGGVPRERAYHDALRDLAVPAMGHPPLVRITVLDGDPERAYAAWDRGRPSPRR